MRNAAEQSKGTVSAEESQYLMDAYDNVSEKNNRQRLESRAIEAMTIATELESIYQEKNSKELSDVISTLYAEYPGITSLSAVKERAIHLFNSVQRVPEKGLTKSIVDVDTELQRLRQLTQFLQDVDIKKSQQEEHRLAQKIEQDMKALEPSKEPAEPLFSDFSPEEQHQLNNDVDTALKIDALYEEIQTLLGKFYIAVEKYPQLQPLVAQFADIDKTMERVPFDQQVDTLTNIRDTLQERYEKSIGIPKASMDQYIALRDYVEQEAYSLQRFKGNTELTIGPLPKTKDEYNKEIALLERQRVLIDNQKRTKRAEITHQYLMPQMLFNTLQSDYANQLPVMDFVRNLQDRLKDQIVDDNDSVQTLFEKQVAIHDIYSITFAVHTYAQSFEKAIQKYGEILKLHEKGYHLQNETATTLLTQLFSYQLNFSDQSTQSIKKKTHHINEIYNDLSQVARNATIPKKTAFTKRIKMGLLKTALSFGIMAIPSSLSDQSLHYPEVPEAQAPSPQRKPIRLDETIIEPDAEVIAQIKEQQKPPIVRQVEQTINEQPAPKHIKKEKAVPVENVSQPSEQAPTVEQVYPPIAKDKQAAELPKPAPTSETKTEQPASKEVARLSVKKGDNVIKLLKTYFKNNPSQPGSWRSALMYAKKHGVNVNLIDIGDQLVLQKEFIKRGKHIEEKVMLVAIDTSHRLKK